MDYVVDTNVPLVAEGLHGGACKECCLDAISWVAHVTAGHSIVLDSGREILSEYRRQLERLQGRDPGLAGKFYEYALAPENHVIAAITRSKTAVFGYDEIPKTAKLQGFDARDFKFIATAVSHGGPNTIVQCADSKWLTFESALAEIGVTVTVPAGCLADLRRALRRKVGSSAKGKTRRDVRQVK